MKLAFPLKIDLLREADGRWIADIPHCRVSPLTAGPETGRRPRGKLWLYG